MRKRKKALLKTGGALLLFLAFSSFQTGYDLLPPPKNAVIAPACSTFPLYPPLAKATVTAPFSYRLDPFTGQVDFHYGLDLSAEEGTEIRAVMGGVVLKAEEQQSYGNYILIDHYNGFQSLYAHCSKLLAKPGEKIESGQVIAFSGSTGRATGPHLHIELRLNGKWLDPGYFWEIYD